VYTISILPAPRARSLYRDASFAIFKTLNFSKTNVLTLRAVLWVLRARTVCGIIVPPTSVQYDNDVRKSFPSTYMDKWSTRAKLNFFIIFNGKDKAPRTRLGKRRVRRHRWWSRRRIFRIFSRKLFTRGGGGKSRTRRVLPYFPSPSGSIQR